jgi:CheY-like chemotaxis protein
MDEDLTNSSKPTGPTGGGQEGECVPVPRKVLHDVNNLLTSIHSGIDLALAGDLPDNLRMFLREAQTSARRGAQLLNACRQRHSEGTVRKEVVARPVETESLEGHEHILIADDEHGFRMLMRAVLAYRGYRITEAADGGEALEKLNTTNPPVDLVILDISMPVKSGWEVLPIVREKFPKLPALMLSGDVNFCSQAPEEGKELTAYLAKPFDNIDLLRLVRRMLNLAKR